MDLRRERLESRCLHGPGAASADELSHDRVVTRFECLWCTQFVYTPLINKRDAVRDVEDAEQIVTDHRRSNADGFQFDDQSVDILRK